MVKTKEIGRNSPRKPLRSGPAIKSTRRSLLTAKATGSRANIRVVVRIRPTSYRESADNFKTVVKPLNNQLLIFDPQECEEAFFYRGVQQRGRDLLKRPNKNIQFSFDRVFNEGNDNEEVFKDSTQGLIKSLMDGCNCSVFVYGATGAGKTYTMLGSAPEHPGITFLTMDELFRAKAELEPERKFELHVSYLEVYNEAVQDLLVTGSGVGGGSTTSLQVQDSKFGVIVAGLTIRKINDAVELFDLLNRGNRNRTQHPTDANAESSRSHAVFQVYLQMDMIATGQRRMAKLSMIDLAGSERGAATGCKGARFTEGANINKSLLALGNCINALADGLRHVPYRDSKLTRLLKDSLGGNCHTVMIANISPSSLCYEDTYNTLKYANRAKKIKANVQKNVGVGDLHVTQYAKLLEERNAENEKLKSENESLKMALQDLKLKSPNGAFVPKSTDCDDGSGDNELDADKEELRTLWGELCGLEERKRTIELCKKKLVSKLEFQEAEANRSGLYPNNSLDQSKANAKSDRWQKQIDTYAKELISLEDIITAANKQVKTFLFAKPSVKSEYDKLSEQFAVLQKDLDVTEYQDMNKLKSDQMVRLGTQLDRTTNLLKHCFWTLQAHKLVTPDLASDYKLLTAPHTVTWRPSPLFDIQNMRGMDYGDIDSGISSTTTLTNPPSLTQLNSPPIDSSTPEHSVRSPKRKYQSPNVDLDCTFTLGGTIRVATTTPQNIKQQSNNSNSNKRLIQYNNAAGSLTSLSSLTSSSKALSSPIISVYTSPAAKRLARGALMPPRISPRLNQQRINNNHSEKAAPAHNNVKRMAAQPHHGTMGTAPRFASATTATANRANRKPLAITQRTDK